MRLKNSIFGMMTASLMLLLGSCSQDTGMDSTGNLNDGSGDAGVVRFKLGGSAGDVITRAGGELQTADEKRVGTLLAVVFRDLDGGAATGTADSEDDADTFVKVIDVLDGGGDLADKEYSFEIGEPGAYQICFVANPGDGLKEKIGALAETSPVSAFKGLVEEQLPETKPMLMTSTFLGAKIGNTETDLGTVRLQRVMSRVDIVNQADGITITKAVLKNRTVKTVLLTDAFGLNSDYLDDGEYTLNLAGNSAPDATDNACTAEIYSYEQYGTSADGKAPAMELTYKIDGDDAKVYTHTVAFKDAQDADVSLKRNTLYRVRVSNSGAGIRFSLTVADWNEGEEFEVGGDQIADGTKPYSTAALGDIMLNDGTLVKADAITDAQKAQAIGVVALLYKDQSRVSQSVRDKLGRDAKGLVWALKKAGNEVSWAETSRDVIGTAYDKLGIAYANSFDGYDITRKMLTGNKDLDNDFVAFGCVQKYQQSHPTPQATTEWYMPSIGELADILSDAGLGGLNIQQVKDNMTDGHTLFTDGFNPVMTALNTAFNVVGSNNMEDFGNQSYWSSSESDIDLAYHVLFDYSRGVFIGDIENRKGSVGVVRCVLAF